jgi:carboxypeptidase C (cathepsin A)
MLRTLSVCAFLALLVPLSGAQEEHPGERPPDSEEGGKRWEVEDELRDELSTTRHTVTVDGETLVYDAVAGRMVMRSEDGDARAQLFSVSYLLTDVEDPASRPVTFVFNGGPGSSSVWLHLGAFGPRRVVMDDEGFPLPPPYTHVENEHSLLDLSDLVFIDPVTTGYSRAAEGVDDGDFHGVEQDVQSVGEFIRLWLTRNERWSSPVYLAGESYGTTRAAKLSRHLQGRHGIYLSGIVLVSSILNFQTADFDPGNDLPAMLHLPTYAAIAWYHGRLESDLQQGGLRPLLDEVEAFVLGEYNVALAQGDDLPQADRERIAARVARYTGLTTEYVLQSNLRVRIGRFAKELMRDERRTVGRLDGRFQGMDADAAGEGYEFDPSMAAIDGPYTAVLNDYLRRELGFESDLPYEILTGRVHPWDYGSARNRYLDVAPDLRRAMTENRALRVYVANGYYDLATPYFATEYTFSHLGLEPELRGNVSMGWFEAGHMMYIDLSSLAQLKADIAAFYAAAD